MDDPVSQFKEWYFKQPLVTRTYLSITFIMACLLSFKVISPLELYYDFSTTIWGLQIWRPFTSLFFQGKFSFSFLFAMFFAYFGLSRVQTQLFERNTYADYLWLCLCLFLSMLVVASILPIYFIGDPFIFANIYIWCKRRPFEIIQLFFGFKVKSGYFPWIFMGFQVLMGASVLGYLLGLFCGHLYITIKDIYLPRYHKDYLPTPNFFKNMVYKRMAREEPRGGVQRPARDGPFGGRGVRLD